MGSECSELVAIRNTMSAYNMAGDRLQIEALADTFLEDGVLKTPTATYAGRSAIVAGLGRRTRDPMGTPAAGPTLVRHNLTTSHVALSDPETAEGRTYFIVLSDVGLDHAGHYVDRLRKVEGVWRFAHRDVRIDWVAEASLFPALKAAHSERQAHRQT